MERFVAAAVQMASGPDRAANVTGAGLGCGGDNNSGPLGNVESLVILQRPKRNDMGDIFQYTSYIPGARLVKLSPPTANERLLLSLVCCALMEPLLVSM